MAADWENLEKHERMRWARRRKFRKMADAARAIGEEEHTYRTWERARANGGRWPPIDKVQEAARIFGVGWIWLETGQGEPVTQETAASRLARLVTQVPKEKADDAINAAASVLESFIDKRR